MAKIDQRRELKELYSPPKDAPAIVDVPEMTFLMVDGSGDPNTAESYREAVEALFAVSYAIKFAVKRGRGMDYRVMPLEGLWWVEDMSTFTVDDKSAWSWTAMIVQPVEVDEELVRDAISTAIGKRPLPAAAQLRLERFGEGTAAQVMHIGPYAEEKPTIDRLHAFIAAEGYELTGKHHEIYLTDARRTGPQRMRTVIRQPIAPAS
jgi:hypothetical protein